MSDPTGAPTPSSGLKGSVASAKRFLAQTTATFQNRDFQRLFDRDAGRAYRVLTRGQSPETADPEEDGGSERLWRAFKGLSARLSPARRVLFLASLTAALLGALNQLGVIILVPLGVPGLWYPVAVLGLVFLLALELADRLQVRDELEVARRLQEHLLPDSEPRLPGLVVAHASRTAAEVGGDYYGFLSLEDGRLALVAGDASGHGMAAGLLMAIGEATLQQAVDLDPSPASVATLVNRSLCRVGGRRSFMTLFYGLLDPGTGRLDYVCAGHPFPLLRRTDGTVEELGSGGLPLGLRRGLEPAVASVVLQPGDLLVLYTDGLPEAVREEPAATYGFDRLVAQVSAESDAHRLRDRLLADLEAFLAGTPVMDDVSLAIVSRLPPLPQ